MRLTNYLIVLTNCLNLCKAKDRTGKALPVQEALAVVMKNVIKRAAAGNKVLFVGNGGSAAIASHMAIDFWKNGSVRSLSFNDPAQLTCLSNDLGYERVFSAPIEMFAEKRDVLIAISSSGRSSNIINAVKSADKKKCWVVTLSGFKPDNPLRTLGDMNFYIPNQSYGIVELAHSVICHYILDTIMELRKNNVSTP